MEHQNDSNLHENHEEHHHYEGFWRKYVFSVDHKTIGIQYGITSLVFLFFWFCPDDVDALAIGVPR